MYTCKNKDFSTHQFAYNMRPPSHHHTHTYIYTYCLHVQNYTTDNILSDKVCRKVNSWLNDLSMKYYIVRKMQTYSVEMYFTKFHVNRFVGNLFFCQKSFCGWNNCLPGLQKPLFEVFQGEGAMIHACILYFYRIYHSDDNSISNMREL